MGWSATLFLFKILKISIESFVREHHRKMKMEKKRSAISLQEAIDFCLDNFGSHLISSTEELSSGEKD